MTASDEELDALVDLSEEFVTATWHLLNNSETSGPIDDPTIAVWQPDYDDVSALLDRCEGLPSGSTEHMTAGELLSANMTDAITALRAQRDEARAERDKMGRALNVARYGHPDFSWEIHKMAMQEAVDQRDRAEAALAAQIEADAMAVSAWGTLSLADMDDGVKWQFDLPDQIAASLRAQPHNTAALDRVKADVRVAAIREAADKLKGQGYNTAVCQILALLDKDGA